MFAAIGNLLGRKPSKPAASAAVRPSFPTSTSRSPARRQDPRDTYSRVFRWRPCSKFSGVAVNVEIVGSFTAWQTVSLTHDPLQDTWTATIQGIPGKRTHHYMLLVNGAPVHDPGCDGFALPMSFEEEQYALQTNKGPRVLMLFSQTK